MRRVTHLPIVADSNVLTLPGTRHSISVESRLPVRPYRLWVDPDVAGGFLIHDVLVNNVSALPARGGVPAAKFSVGQGDRLDGEVVLPGECVTLLVEYIGRQESGELFCGAWSAVVLPLDVAQAARRSGVDVDLDGGPWLGVEQPGTRIRDVLDRGRRSSPPSGWDPYPDT